MVEDSAKQGIELEQLMGFPETLAKQSNRMDDEACVTMVFRNYYKHLEQDTQASQTPQALESNEEAATQHVREVTRIERMYDRKVQKAIKQ